MKSTLFYSITMPLSAFALSASMSVAAANKEPGTTNITYTEKKISCRI